MTSDGWVTRMALAPHVVLAACAAEDHRGWTCVPGKTQAIVWHGPGHGVTENESDSGQTVLELLNRFGADGWRKLAALPDYRGCRTRTARLFTVYTFKRSVSEQFSHRASRGRCEYPTLGHGGRVCAYGAPVRRMAREEPEPS